MKKYLFLLLVVTTLFFSCASSIKSSLGPNEITVNGSEKAINITQVIGGESDINNLLVQADNIDADEFKTALIESIQNTKLCQILQDEENADFNLQALIISATSMPPVLLDIDANLAVQYKIIQKDQVLFDETITSTCHKSVGDNFVAVSRWKAAKAGAIKLNIKQFIEKVDSSGIL